MQELSTVIRTSAIVKNNCLKIVDFMVSGEKEMLIIKELIA